MKADLILYNIGTLLTPNPSDNPVKGKALNDLKQLKNAFIAINDGTILEVGVNENYKNFIGDDTELYDVQGCLVTPGLIDSHTHVVHGGSREFEFEKKMAGVPYLKILEEGGGIHSTVNATRMMDEKALFNQAKKSLIKMMEFGVTTVEGKSGYGLEESTELKQLRVQKRLHEKLPIDIVSTFMGAHAIPSEYKDNHKEYLDEVIKWMDSVKSDSLAEFVDIFCEEGVFTAKESDYLLSEAIKKGFKVKIHADEIASIGGVDVAAKLNATSADHLMAITNKGIEALKKSNVVANILPATSFYLNSTYAPVRTMINEGCAIALSSDYNPGSSPSENYMFTLNLAAIHLKMSPNEILNAATINPSFSVNRQGEIGVIDKGYQADINVYDAKNWPYVLYHYGINHIKDVFKNGRLIVKDQKYVKE